VIVDMVEGPPVKPSDRRRSFAESAVSSALRVISSET
jgi:hypothetical protein